MASSNEGDGGVLRRMVKMVASPARDLMGMGADTVGHQFADAEKAELKAMIERKRRNDFVRKRELNMLRRIRREGLTPEQAASLDATSRMGMDDSEARLTQPPSGADRGVKAKIDAIEKQMVGAGSPPVMARLGALPATSPVSARTELFTAGGRRQEPPAPEVAATVPAGLVDDALDEGTRPMMMMPADALPLLTEPVQAVAAPTPSPTRTEPATPSQLPSMEVSEAAHDRDLDEAVIAFANADFVHAERALVTLVAPKGARVRHEETWLALFDLYRATGQQPRFDELTAAFGPRFQKSSPQWYSLPRLVAQASFAGTSPTSSHSDVGWVCPAQLDADAMAALTSQTLQLPQPWVMDWTALQRIDPDAVNLLHRQLQGWADQVLEMRWLASERLFDVLQDSAPVGVRDADPGYWLARLDALRLINRPDQFDEIAIDYCVTYEVSPPSWAATRCVTRVIGSAMHTRSAPLSVVGDPVTTLQGGADSPHVPITTLDLSGQLSGDLAPVLAALDAKLGGASVVRISCALLIRVDFIAAGDLLNWVIARKAEGRHISFIDVHRLVALMFGAMGISEHAPVHLRQG